MNKLFYISSIGLGILALLLFYHDDHNRSIFYFVNSVHPHPILWLTITNTGGFMFAGCLLIIILRNHLQLLANALIAALALHLIVNGGKTLFSIARPIQLNDFPNLIALGPMLQDYSMPSGHTAIAFMVAMFIIHRYALLSWHLWFVVLLASLVGISRMAVGAHWPSDVLAGAALGIFIGRICADLRFRIDTNAIKYSIYILCLPFILLSIYHVTAITNLPMIITDGIITLAGLIALLAWSLKIKRELQHDGFIEPK